MTIALDPARPTPGGMFEPSSLILAFELMLVGRSELKRFAAAHMSASGPVLGCPSVSESSAKSSNSKRLAVAFELDRESRLRDHRGAELVDREPDDRSAEGVGGVAHQARAGGHLGARDPDRVPQGMPGAKLIAQMRTPSGTSSSIR